MRTVLSILGCLLWTPSAFAAGAAPPAAEESSLAESKQATAEDGASSSSDTSSASQPTLSLGEARQAFLKGRALIAEGRWAEAEEQFLLAIRAKNTPGLHYYIGYCRENQGSLVLALASYRMAEDLLETERAPDVDQIVPAAIERVTGLLPVILLYDVPAGAKLKFDGVERPLSQQFHADPGRHLIQVEKAGFKSFSTAFDLEAGKKARVVVKMEPAQQNADRVTPGEDVRSDSGSLRKVLFWSSTGVALGGLGAGVTGAVLLAATKREIERLDEEAEEIAQSEDSSCLQPSAALERVCSDLEAGAKRKKSMGTLMVGGFAAAGVGTVGALVTHFLWPEARVSVDLGLSEGEQLVFVSGQF